MADTPQGPEAEVGEQVIGGNNSRMRSEVKAGLKIDTQQLSKLKQHLREARDITKEWRLEMEKLAKASQTVNMGGGGSGPGDGGGGNEVTKGFSNVPTPPPVSRGLQGFAKAGGIAATIGGFISPMVGQLDARIDRGMAYASSADRLNLLTQQMTGMSQMQAMQQRQGLTQYRLGAGGINAATQFGLSTGQTITPGMARSIEAIRASTGFTKSTGDILNEQRQLMDPNVANRMFFMGGVNAYNIGGGMKDPLQMRQEIIQRMGLTNESVLKGALTPGSVTRARMADMGIGEEMQTEFLQYAHQQAAFREKGGKGFYDPSKASHRQMMGIEGNLATQQEETQRISDAREEQFMIRQIDNMAALEKSNQRLIEMMGKLEDTMSGLIGTRISTRPYQKSIGGALKGIGGALMTGAAVATVGSGGALTPVTAAVAGIGGLMLGAGSLMGDPANPDAAQDGLVTQAASRGHNSSAKDSETMVPYGYGGGKISLSELKNKPDFNKLNPKFKERLLQMMRANPNVGIGGGTRDSSMQETMFKSRYRRTDKETGIFWDGSYWEHVSGAAAAPPGRSFHEIGLAADLVGDLDWMNAHAHEFGLKHFAGVNNEPWHVQPADLPNSRKKYEEQGAPWGTDGRYNQGGELDDGSISGSSDHSDHGSGGQPSGVGGVAGVPNFGGMSIQEVIDKASSAGLSRMLSASGTLSQAPAGGNVKFKPSQSAGQTATVGSGSAQAAAAAYRAGFRGDDLIKIVAIAGRESGWNPRAKNPNTSDHGMWQINWSSNKDIAKSLGANNAEDLFDPYLNAKVAFELFNNAKSWAKGDNPGFHPWRGSDTGWNNSGPGWDGNGDEMWHADKFVSEATAATAQYRSGDPMLFAEPTRGSSRSGSGGSRSTTNHITSSPTINVAPVINFNGAPATPDLRNIAQTVSRLIKEEVDMMNLRTA